MKVYRLNTTIPEIYPTFSSFADAYKEAQGKIKEGLDGKPEEMSIPCLAELIATNAARKIHQSGGKLLLNGRFISDLDVKTYDRIVEYGGIYCPIEYGVIAKNIWRYTLKKMCKLSVVGDNFNAYLLPDTTIYNEKNGISYRNTLSLVEISGEYSITTDIESSLLFVRRDNKANINMDYNMFTVFLRNATVVVDCNTFPENAIIYANGSGFVVLLSNERKRLNVFMSGSVLVACDNIEIANVKI
ncbi:MAG: hypothetical protein KatS3mg031_2979 [Chitinophagales bacterium]|nr:MAG: hypothetical protein KatS3mg031_2979 [Chitinophagales bacterium]